MNTIARLFTGRSRSQDKYISLLRPHVDTMYRMAFRWSGSQQDAEDLVQEVLITLVDRIDEMRSVEQLRPWLIKIVYRRFIDLQRKQTRRPEFTESSLSEADAVSFSAGDNPSVPAIQGAPSQTRDPAQSLSQQEVLEWALSNLEPAHKDVILLHDAEGYTATEVAEILEISIGTVKSRLHRAREKIKKILPDGTFS